MVEHRQTFARITSVRSCSRHADNANPNGAWNLLEQSQAPLGSNVVRHVLNRSDSESSGVRKPLTQFLHSVGITRQIRQLALNVQRCVFAQNASEPAVRSSFVLTANRISVPVVNSEFRERGA